MQFSSETPSGPRHTGRWVAALLGAAAFACAGLLTLGMHTPEVKQGLATVTTSALPAAEPAPTVTVTVTATPKANKPKPVAKPKPTINGDTIVHVGEDVPAGTYRAQTDVAGMDCYWMKSSDAEGSNIIDNDLPSGGRPQVTLKRGQWFVSNRCATWIRR